MARNNLLHMNLYRHYGACSISDSHTQGVALGDDITALQAEKGGGNRVNLVPLRNGPILGKVRKKLVQTPGPATQKAKLRNEPICLR